MKAKHETTAAAVIVLDTHAWIWVAKALANDPAIEILPSIAIGAAKLQ